ncbi:MAG: hypothetical protein ACRCWG_03050 [Sarcina sp.]
MINKDIDLDSYIYKLLNNLGIPVRFGWYDASIKDTHITYQPYNIFTDASDYANDKCKLIKSSYQVDIWSLDRKSLNDFKAKITKLILDNDSCYFNDSRYFFETDTKVYRYCIRFTIIQMM